MSKVSLNESEFTSSTNSLTTDDILTRYYEAFHMFRKNKSTISPNDLLSAMRCAGANPTEQELQDIKNKLDDGSGEIVFNDFCKVMSRIYRDHDEETFYKETFRTFSKDSDGCIPSQEIKFVFEHLGMKDEEIDEMMDTIDRNGDGKISYTEFRKIQQMDKRFKEIEPWKVELVQEFFNKSSNKKEPGLQASKTLGTTVRDSEPKANTGRGSACEMGGSVKAQGVKEGEILSSFPPIRVCRPKFVNKTKTELMTVTDKRKFPIKQIGQDQKDQGRNCVSVILKSSSSSPSSSSKYKVESVSSRVASVQKLSRKYQVKYQGRSTQKEDVRLDFCFKSPTEARNFFGKVNDLARSKDSPKLISVLMNKEEHLGYQHHPVLTEKDLLTVQSPNYISNIFKTSVRDIIVDINSSNEVFLSFATVADVNAFLFEVTHRKEHRTLGELKANSKNLSLKPQQGYFVLQAKDVSSEMLESARETFNFRLSGDTEVTKLKFKDKLNMFNFFLSDQGMKVKQLGFDQSQIVSSSVKPSEKGADSTDRGLDRDEHNNNSKDKVVDIRTKAVEVETQTELSLDGLDISKKDEEINCLRTDLKAKEVAIERQDIQKKKIENKFFELQNGMQSISAIVSSFSYHESE